MKKKGLGLGALIGTILGVVVVIVLSAIIYKLIPLGSEKVCSNENSWTNLKNEFKKIEGGQAYSTIFNNKDCYLASFDLEDLSYSSPVSAYLNPDQQLIQKQKPAICLCNIESIECPQDPDFICSMCEIRDIIKDCYFFEDITDFNINGKIDQLNTGRTAKEQRNYNLLINFERKDSTLFINYILQ